MAADTARTALHDLVDALPEEEVAAAERYLRFLGSGQTDLVQRTLDTAPPEDEPISPDGNAGAEEAWREFRNRETVSAEEAKRLLST
jgi:hypothetical protein